MTENINIFAFRKVVQVVQVTWVTTLIDFSLIFNINDKNKVRALK